LRSYGATGEDPPSVPISPTRSTPTSAAPSPAPEPVLEQPIPVTGDDASQRSVLLGGRKPLGFNQQKQSSAGPSSQHGQQPHAALKGSVAGVDKQHGRIVVVFAGNQLPGIGSKVQVFQKVLFSRDLLGEFRVIGVQGNAVVAQPIGKIDLELILTGDEAAAS
jgi:hypothetical protein